MFDLRWNLSALAFITGCWHASAATTSASVPSVGSGPCAGSALDFDEVVARCATNAAITPAPATLVLGLAESSAPSGGSTAFEVTVKNADRGPLQLVFAPGCAFLVTVFDSQGHAINFEGDEPLGGLCASGGAVDITLAPGGVLTKRVPWDVRKTRFVCANDRCDEVPGSPIAPGTYRAELTTPFGDPVGGDPHVVSARTVSAPFVVTP